MAKENIEDLSTEVLIKRKRFVTFIIGAVIGIIIVILALLGISLVKNEPLDFISILPAIAMVVTAIPMRMALKKINAELVSRDSNLKTRS